MPLTDRQKHFLYCIAKHIDIFKYPPTLKELRILSGCRSEFIIQKYINELAGCGAIHVVPNVDRGFLITKNGLEELSNEKKRY